jgi:protocatechuate 3,4-dioxygenase beta subunit
MEALMPLSRRRALTVLSASALAACVARVEGEEAAAAVAGTPAQTEGPFFPVDTDIERDADLTRLAGRSERAAGQIIEVRGRVLDINGQPVAGARLDIWQANAAGRYAHPGDAVNTAPLDPNFQGYAHLTTGADGGYSLVSIRPGGYDVAGIGRRTPHIHWKAEAGARRLTTQMYFPGEPENEADGVLRGVRRPDLVIARTAAADEAGALGFIWDIVLA